MPRPNCDDPSAGSYQRSDRVLIFYELRAHTDMNVTNDVVPFLLDLGEVLLHSFVLL